MEGEELGLARKTVVQEGSDGVVGDVMPQQQELLPHCFNRHPLRGDLRMQLWAAHLSSQQRRLYVALQSSLNVQYLDPIVQSYRMIRKPMANLIGHLVTVSSYHTPLENREISHASKPDLGCVRCLQAIRAQAVRLSPRRPKCGLTCPTHLLTKGAFVNTMWRPQSCGERAER